MTADEPEDDECRTETKRPLEIEAAAFLPQARSGARQRLGRDVDREPVLSLVHDREAHAGTGDRGAEIDSGHIVTGHVDGVGEIEGAAEAGGSLRLSIIAGPEIESYIAPKGSVALDGVSLTVNEVTDDTFSVLIIPHTLKVTTLGALAAGDHVNLEVDLMARYAARLMARP